MCLVDRAKEFVMMKDVGEREEAKGAPGLGLSRWEHPLPFTDQGRLRGAGSGERGLKVRNPILNA